VDSLAEARENAINSRNENSPLYQSKGKLLWRQRDNHPGFGRQKHPEFGTFYDYRGIDIEAPVGQPVCAVADGEVRYADWFRGYGKIVIIDHKVGFFTLYGHLGGD